MLMETKTGILATTIWNDHWKSRWNIAMLLFVSFW